MSFCKNITAHHFHELVFADPGFLVQGSALIKSRVVVDSFIGLCCGPLLRMASAGMV
jgi:hypothetical protein